MEKFEEEPIGFDITFEIECVIYDMLKKTISKAIDDELKKEDAPPLIVSKDIMLKNILIRNIEGLEEQQYMTAGPEGKTYLCGIWLMRPVLTEDGSYISTMDYLKANLDTTNIVFIPNKSGIDLRKELWFAKNKEYTSYNLPKDCRINSPVEDTSPMELMQMSGRPSMPGMKPAESEKKTTEKPLLSISELFESLKKEIRTTLEETISHSVDENVAKTHLPPPPNKEMMVKGIAARNIDEMEKSQYIFIGPDDKVYLCGNWLLRQVVFGEAKLPFIARLKQQFYQYYNIEYRPDAIGTHLQAEMQK